MSEKQAKTLKNPELRTKFTVGQIVDIPRRVAYRHTSKMGVLMRPVLGRVVSLGDRQVGKHYRFAVDIRYIWGVMEVWEEWQLEMIHPATADQIQRAGGALYLQDEPKHQSQEVRVECHSGVAEASA